MTLPPSPPASAHPRRVHILHLLWRRRLTVAFVSVLALAAGVAYLRTATPVYESSARVLLTRQNLAYGLTGVPDPVTQGQDFFQIAQTQADLANSRVVAARALARVPKAGLTIRAFLANSEALARRNTDILVFTVQGTQRPTISALATAFARSYTQYRRELDTASLATALKEVQRKIASLASESGRLYEQLITQEQQLQTLRTLQTSNASLIESASLTDQISPNGPRTIFLCIVFGLSAGIALALVRESLDTRLRDSVEISSELDAPILSRLPTPTSDIGRRGVIMLTNPSSLEADGFRILRTSLQFAQLDRQAKTIMVTSAVETEGKSTTVANLAAACARGGARVVLVDLDLRRPTLHRLFGLDSTVGISSVVLGDVPLSAAMQRVYPTKATGTSVGASPDGVLDVITAGATPPDVGEFVSSLALATVLSELAHRVDLVLLDSPPLLRVGDPLALSERVDAMILVARLGSARRAMLRELTRLLDLSPARVLGIALTAADSDQATTGYGYPYAYGEGGTPRDRHGASDRVNIAS